MVAKNVGLAYSVPGTILSIIYILYIIYTYCILHITYIIYNTYVKLFLATIL